MSVFCSKMYCLYKIGVLAYKRKASAMKRWFYHQTYLNKKLAPLKFEIVPLGYVNDEITNAVINQNVDFLITNPGNYIELELAGYVSRFATRRMKGPAGALDKFGGVAITLPHRTDINKYSDLIGKDISIPSMSSLGGWQVHLGEVLAQGIDLRLDANITELKNHSKVVKAVIAGGAEVGLVRADLIEQLVSDGVIRFNQIKVINKQTISGYPYLLSTRLYPEWPFAIVTGTSTDIATKVVAALLDIHETDPVAIDSGIYGWTALGPYKDKPITLNVAIEKYKYQLLIILTFFVMLLIITVRTKISKDILALEIDERKRAENALSKNK